MAKLNKIMPPRNTTIRGNDHLLAYITPEEAQLLICRPLVLRLNLARLSLVE
jgi:hypothetical protein